MESLERFKEAHERDYITALEEIKHGRKENHWMWYIFPQIKGLGFSEISIYYSIKSLEEAHSYLNDELLGSHLKEITSELLKLKTNNPEEIFGDIDALKLFSCMTLFDHISKDNIFYKVLEKYYDGRKDEKTLEICKTLI